MKILIYVVTSWPWYHFRGDDLLALTVQYAYNAIIIREDNSSTGPGWKEMNVSSLQILVGYIQNIVCLA